MKKSFLFLAAFVIMLQVCNAQIKVFPDGKVSYGNTTSPTTKGVSHLMTGNLFSFSATTAFTSCAALRGNNSLSTATTPDYTWFNNDQTGLFHPSNGIIGFTSNGTEKMRIGSTIQMNTTSLNSGILNMYRAITTYGQPIIYIQAAYTGDWRQSMVTRINNQLSANYVLNLNGTDKFYVLGDGSIYSNGVYLGSDENIKDSLKNIEGAMEKVKKLNGVTYKLKQELSNPETYGSNPKRYMGLLAQDVEIVAPEAVKLMADSTKAVCYEMLIGLLVEAIKEQGEQIVQMQDELDNCCKKGLDDGTKSQIINGNENIESTETGCYLKQNRPNPFSDQTTIDYAVNVDAANAQIMVFDMTGKLIKSYNAQKGINTLTISNSEFTPGMYYYSLVVDDKEIDTKKMIISK